MEQLIDINQLGTRDRNSAVEKLCTLRDEVLHDIGTAVRAPGRNYHAELRRDSLMKANKDQLCSWVETLVLALSGTALPLLQDAVKDTISVESLRKSKIDDQATIINLQKKLIDAKELQVKKLQDVVKSEVSTVKNEMKTFSSVLQEEMKNQSSEVTKNFASVVSVKKIGDAVKNAAEKEGRNRNLVVYGVAEEAEEQLKSRVENILENTGMKPRIVECSRLGRVHDGNIRPVKVMLESVNTAREVLRNSKLLRNVDGCRGIFICPDRTVEERRTQKELINQLRQKRLENPNDRYHIRSGQIVLYTGT